MEFRWFRAAAIAKGQKTERRAHVQETIAAQRRKRSLVPLLEGLLKHARMAAA